MLPPAAGTYVLLLRSRAAATVEARLQAALPGRVQWAACEAPISTT